MRGRAHGSENVRLNVLSHLAEYSLREAEVAHVVLVAKETFEQVAETVVPYPIRAVR